MGSTSTASSSLVEKLRQALEKNQGSAEAHLKLGTALIQVRKFNEAEQVLRKALELDAECVEAWVNLGGILLARFDFKGCVEVNQKAAACNPCAVQAHYNMGLGHLYLDQAEKMVHCFQRVLELESEHPGGHYYLAVGLHALGRTPEAWAHYKKAMDLGHAPQPEFVREMEKFEKNKGGSVAAIEIGPDSKGNSTQHN